jgi:hypothetical protein
LRLGLAEGGQRHRELAQWEARVRERAMRAGGAGEAAAAAAAAAEAEAGEEAVERRARRRGVSGSGFRESGARLVEVGGGGLDEQQAEAVVAQVRFVRDDRHPSPPCSH